MDLLENDSQKKQESKSKKVVGTLLIISIIALVLVIVLIMLLKTSQPKDIKYKLSINNKDSNSETIQIGEGIDYVVIEEISKDLGYTYYNGIYLGQATEKKDNCYLKDKNEVICLEINTNEFYKTAEESIVEKQKYKAKYNIMSSEKGICVAIEDLIKMFNIEVEYNQESHKINIFTKEALASTQEENISSKQLEVTLDKSFENLKAISRGMIVVIKENQYGVINNEFKSIIGNKYKSMEYDEYTNTFIVSDSNDQYGVITNEGNSKISLKYDNIYIVSYEPLLYAVTKDQKYGVINEKEHIVVNIEYEKLSCAGDAKKNTGRAFIIPGINDGEDGIVVCKDSKYGIVSLSTGKDIVPCVADQIISKAETNEKKKYFVLINTEEIELQKYIKAINTTTVKLTNSVKDQIEE